MFFNGFPSFSAIKSTARHGTPTQPQLTHASHTVPTPSKKPSRLQSVLKALHLSRPRPKVDEQYHQPQATHTSSVALQVPPCPATHQGTTISASARPSASSTPLSIPHSTFLTADSARLTLPRSAATTPAISSSTPPVASTATVPPHTAYNAAATKRISELEFAVLQLERDNACQISDTNALFDKKIYPRMMAFTKERDDEKAARKLAEDRLEEVVASHAKMGEVIIKERERHRKAERARIEACFALEEKNSDLQAALLDLQTRTNLLNIDELQKALVRLGIVDPDGQQYPLAYPVCSDCVAPFLKSVCAAAKRSTNSGEGRDQEQKLELARAGHRTFEVSDDEDGCSGESELVSEEPARTLSEAPAPAQWFGSRSTRSRRFD